MQIGEKMLYACVVNNHYFGKGFIDYKTDFGFAVNMEDGSQQEFLPDELIPYTEYVNMVA